MTVDVNQAEQDLLACATYLTEKIKSSDGHAEAISEILPHYLAKNDVDLAAEMADSIEDPFTRDKLLVLVAEKCAEIKDDEYAFQLVEAIEDFTIQASAAEKIVAQKAKQKNFETALQATEFLSDDSHALSVIASEQNPNEALQTIDKIEFPLTKVHSLLELGTRENNLEYIEKAVSVADEINLNEEHIRALNDIADHFISLKRNDLAIQTLDKARKEAEKLNNYRRDTFLSNISVHFFRAGSVDLADRTLDAVEDKYYVSTTLLGFAEQYFAQKETEDAVDALEESYAILKSQGENEIRDSKARFELFAMIAIRFAVFGKYERALEIADENQNPNARLAALSQIAQVAVLNNKDEFAEQASNLVNDDSERVMFLISLSDVKKNRELNEDALHYLNESYLLCETIPQLPMRVSAFNELIVRYCELGKIEKGREICTENLQTIAKILDESQKVSGLSALHSIFEEFNFQLNEQEKQILQTLVRKAEW
jgi:tetratricopeptide (TPR) repeat protein